MMRCRLSTTAVLEGGNVKSSADNNGASCPAASMLSRLDILCLLYREIYELHVGSTTKSRRCS